MKISKWLSAAAAGALLTTFLLNPLNASAEWNANIEDESIYDLLVDRFFNGSGQNDFNVDTQDHTAFNGGDFQGLISKKSYIEKMGFSIISIGSVFDTNTYDGRSVTSYEKLEEHFGTEEELQQVITSFKKSDMRIMVDFPLSELSNQHEWFANGANSAWIASAVNGYVKIDLANSEVQQALKEALTNFVKKFEVSIRLTNIEGADESFLNELIQIVKTERPQSYVITNEVSSANFDAQYDDQMIERQRNIFKTVDQDSSDIVIHTGSQPITQVMIDSPWSDRFVLYGEKEGMYPPTRVRMAALSSLLIPGLPVMQYGTEIAMNGTAGSEAHQLYNFKTDTELMDQISNVQLLLNSSDTLRKGNFEVLSNENGYLAFLRTSDTEQWLVVINNTSRTKKVVLSEEKIGKDKKIVSILNPENVRADKNGNYSVILDREMVEIYHIQDDTGINISYIIALGLVYILFTIFVVLIIKRGKVRRAEQDNVQQ